MSLDRVESDFAGMNEAKFELTRNLRIDIAQDQNDFVFVRLVADKEASLAVLDPRRVAGLHYVCEQRAGFEPG